MDVCLIRIEDEKISKYKERCLRTFIEYVEVHFNLRYKFEILYSDDLIDETKPIPLGLTDQTKVPEDGSLLCITKDKVFHCFSRTIMMGNPRFYSLPLGDISELVNGILAKNVIPRNVIYDLGNMDKLPTDLPDELTVRLDRLKELKQVQDETSKTTRDFNNRYEGMSRIERQKDMMAHVKSRDWTLLKKLLPKDSGIYEYSKESYPLAKNYIESKLEEFIQSDIGQQTNEIVFKGK